MKKNEQGVNIIPIEVCVGGDTGMEYVFSNGEWFTRIDNTYYPVLALVTTTTRYLIAVNDNVLRTIWFEWIDGKYVLQYNKYYSMIDYTVYDLNEYTLVKEMYVPLEKGVIRRAVFVGKNDLFTPGQYCYRTFDDSVFSLREAHTGQFMCHNNTVILTDKLIVHKNKYINQDCKVVFLASNAYCYWKEKELVYTTVQQTQQINRKEAVLSLAIRDRLFVAFGKNTSFFKGCLKGDYILGKEGEGVFEFFHKKKWDYIYTEGGSTLAKSLSNTSFVLCQKLFYDYYFLGGDLYLVLSNSSILATTSLEFYESIVKVSVILLPISSVVIVETTDQICTIKCTIQEGVIQCQELDSH